MKSPQRSLLVLTAMLLALAIMFMFDDVIFYLLFERLLGLKPNWLAKLGSGFIITMLNVGLALLVMKSLKEQPRTGAEGMVGEHGVVERVASPYLWVKLRGELWRAKSRQPVTVGEKVVVLGLEGLTLEVERLQTDLNGGAL
jgi:membrane-bound serine protease (ClpP class)